MKSVDESSAGASFNEFGKIEKILVGEWFCPHAYVRLHINKSAPIFISIQGRSLRLFKGFRAGYNHLV
jgi:hypothetical protein